MFGRWSVELAGETGRAQTHIVVPGCIFKLFCGILARVGIWEDEMSALGAVKRAGSGVPAERVFVRRSVAFMADAAM